VQAIHRKSLNLNTVCLLDSVSVNCKPSWSLEICSELLFFAHDIICLKGKELTLNIEIAHSLSKLRKPSLNFSTMYERYVKITKHRAVCTERVKGGSLDKI